jgi:hypothetical protein
MGAKQPGRPAALGTLDKIRSRFDAGEGGRLYETEPSEPEQDPVSSLHDTDEEAGDQEGLIDTFSIDTRAAKELGVELDSADGQEPELD